MTTLRKSRAKRILFVTGSLGLGHLTRDLAIVAAFRRIHPDVELVWLAYKTVGPLLQEAGEILLPEAQQMADGNVTAEKAAQAGFRLSLSRYLSQSRRDWMENVEVFKRVVEKHDFDLVVGDEAYELVLALLDGRVSIKSTFLSIYDFIGLDPMGHNPLERVVCYLAMRKFVKRISERVVSYAFVGEEEDVVDRPWGFLLPNRRLWAREFCHFLGYITQFDPKEFSDRSRVRRDLGYGGEPLIICSIGGTAVGKELLELCGQAYSRVKSRIPDLRMILVCGPRLLPNSLRLPKGVETRAYVPDLYKHFAACDLAIVQAGGTTTIELTALRRPFLYFPLEDHYEQQVYVSGRLERHRAGIRMHYSLTTPDSLADEIVSNIGKDVDYFQIPTDGAENAAQIMSRLLEPKQ